MQYNYNYTNLIIDLKLVSWLFCRKEFDNVFHTCAPLKEVAIFSNICVNWKDM